MTKFRKKPVEIEAVQWTGNNLEEIKEFVGKSLRVRGSLIIIVTLEGEMIASDNDWIIKGVNGEFYPCKPDIFEKTYDEIKEITFIDRLEIERNDLQDKFTKLEKFFGTETFKNLSIEMKRLMKDQSSVMEDYITILNQRMELLKS